MTASDIMAILQVVAPAVAVYAAIRADMAALKVRVEHLERDLYPQQDRRGQAG
jgi:hypothetical protein